MTTITCDLCGTKMPSHGHHLFGAVDGMTVSIELAKEDNWDKDYCAICVAKAAQQLIHGLIEAGQLQ